ncbi:MAG: regulatory signaling modulator protein AmpE [Thiotrichales bacterium]|nr:regulatory signaling modulator protein AmpE [Thiotrichales bacterium]
MTLIAVILALVLGRMLGDPRQRQPFDWFDQMQDWLEKQLSPYRIWDSPAGILITVAIPLIVLVIIMEILGGILFILPYIVAVLVLYACLGYESCESHLERYKTALQTDNDAEVSEASAAILEQDNNADDSEDFTNVAGSLFRQSNDRIFAVIFWFLVLGPLGALLYRLVYEMLQKRHDIHGSYSESVRDMYNILNWPCIRLSILSYALVGSLIHTIEAWREREEPVLETDASMISDSGFAAIACGDIEESDREQQLYCLEHMDGLITRSLILWLTLIALSTISGWLA